MSYGYPGRALALTSEYGDVLWNLFPSMAYVAGTEIPCIIYVANPTDEDREYMLMAQLVRGGATLIEYPIRVDDLTWFPVEAGTVIEMPGALILGYTDAALVMNLYEKEENRVVDSVSTALISAGTAGFPGLPGLPEIPGAPGEGYAGIDLSNIITMVVMVMMMGVMMKVVK